MALQYGVPANSLIQKFSHVRFEPSGWTPNPKIPVAKSVVDYVFRWLGTKFLNAEEQNHLGIVNRDDGEIDPGESHVGVQTDAPACSVCGTIMMRSGVCYRCPNCGVTSGCS